MMRRSSLFSRRRSSSLVAPKFRRARKIRQRRRDRLLLLAFEAIVRKSSSSRLFFFFPHLAIISFVVDLTYFGSIGILSRWRTQNVDQRTSTKKIGRTERKKAESERERDREKIISRSLKKNGKLDARERKKRYHSRLCPLRRSISYFTIDASRNNVLVRLFIRSHTFRLMTPSH